MAAKAKAPTAKKSAKKKPPSKQAMTAKMRLWLSLFLDKSNPATFLNKAGAARAAGYKANSDNAFASIGCQNYRKLQGEIEKWIDNEGLGEYQLKAKIIEGLECTETVFKAHEIKGSCYIIYDGQAYDLQEALQSDYEGLREAAKAALRGQPGVQDGSVIDSGYLIEQREVIPWDVRRKYLELACDVKGMKAPGKLQLSGPDGGPVQVEYTDTQRAARIEGLLAIAARRKAEQDAKTGDCAKKEAVADGDS